MNHEQAGDMRAMVLRGTVEAVRDDGPMQVVDVRTADGVLRTDIEVPQLYGLSHRPPPGALVLMLAVGGDPGDYMALPAFNPSAGFGNMADGEIGLYRFPDGTRIMLRGGGKVEILAASEVTISTGSVAVTAPEGITMTVGGVEMAITTTGVAVTGGQITADGAIVAGLGTADQVTLQHHEHPTAEPGGPSPPTAGT